MKLICKVRRGPYLDMTSISVFKINQLFGTVTTIEPDTYVLCDVFGVRECAVSATKMSRQAHPYCITRPTLRRKTPTIPATYADRIYNVDDNRYLVDLKTLTSSGAARQGTIVWRTIPTCIKTSMTLFPTDGQRYRGLTGRIRTY